MRLFDVPSLEDSRGTTNAAQYQSLGISAEYLLTARLLELGHKVAVPVTDDDGVDLIVNYSTLVQVKSSAYRKPNGSLRVASPKGRRGGSANIAQHVDIIAIYARDSRTWWFLPRDRFTGTWFTIELSEMRPNDPWREDWSVFDRMGGHPARED